MPTGDQQSEERIRRWVIFQHDRQQMSFHVVYGNNRAIPCHRQAIGQAASDHQSTDKAWASCLGERVRALCAGLLQHLPNEWQQASNVVS